MDSTAAIDEHPEQPVPPPPTEPEPVLVEQDLLVEDVSIDGMCGVY